MNPIRIATIEHFNITLQIAKNRLREWMEILRIDMCAKLRYCVLEFRILQIIEYTFIRMKQFRNNGAKGAILDEYERAIHDLKNLIFDISDQELTKIVDPDSDGPRLSIYSNSSNPCSPFWLWLCKTLSVHIKENKWKK